jgi:hypothetical protein
VVTVTVTFFATAPPAPAHVIVKVLFVVSTFVDCEPASAFVPVHAPEAEHEVASVELQLIVVALPEVTVERVVLRVTVGRSGGGGGRTRPEVIVNGKSLESFARIFANLQRLSGKIGIIGPHGGRSYTTAEIE